MITKVEAKQAKGSFKGMIRYQEKKIEQGVGELLINCTAGTNAEGIIRDFEQQTELNDRLKKNPAMELTINLNPKDRKFSNHEFVNLAQDYMKKMGYEDVPFAIYRHHDKDFQHIHIITTKVKYDGSLVDTYYDKYRAMTLSREFEKQYELVPTEYKIQRERKQQKELAVDRYSIEKALRKHKFPEPTCELLGEKIIDQIKGEPRLSNNQIKHELEKQGRLETYGKLLDYLETNKMIYRLEKDKLTDTLYMLKKFSENSKDFFSKLKKNRIYFRIMQKPEGEMITYGKDGFYYKKVPRQFQLDQIRALDHPKKKVEHSQEKQKRFMKATLEKTLRHSYSIDDLVRKMKAKGILVQLYGKPGSISGMAFKNESIEGGLRFKASDLNRDLSISHILQRLEKNQKYLPEPMKKQLSLPDPKAFIRKIAFGMDEQDSEEQADRLKYKSRGF